MVRRVGIERLKLTNNAFTDLAPLAQLTRLEQLLLDDNPVTELGPVAGLPRLKLLSLKGNAQLRCSELEPSLLSPLLEVIPPEHCTRKQAED